MNLASRRLSPHAVMFAVVNGAYWLPVFVAFAFNYAEGGVAETLDVDASLVFRFTLTYFLAVVCFYLGAFVFSKIAYFARPARKTEVPQPSRPVEAPLGLRLANICIGLTLVASKVLLIPSGVYSVYAFDADLMVGGLWTASMALSESMVMLIVALIVFGKKPWSPHVVFAFLCLSTNLLHGTRIFTVAVLLEIGLFYALTTGLTRRRLAYGAVAVAVAFAALYFAFVSRTEYSYSDDATALTVAVSPVVYEAVFSQMSLLRYLALDQIDWLGHPFRYVLDTASFIVPRFLNPDKDSGGLLANYGDLSPLGGFSGHAAGLIYFGYGVYLVYFLLGGFGSWLQRRARTSPMFLAIYIYFSADILFRLMRDGAIYPVKYFVNSVVLLLISVYLFSGARRSRSRSTGPTGGKQSLAALS